MHCSLASQVDGSIPVFGLNVDAMIDVRAFVDVRRQCSSTVGVMVAGTADSAHIKNSMIPAFRVSSPLRVLEANTSAQLSLTVISHENMYRQQPT